jgi:hypothetical protein
MHNRRARGRGHRRVLASAFTAVLVGALCATAGATSGTSHPRAHKAQANPLQSNGMWIWVLGASDRGNLQAIISQAHRYGVGTLFIKSSDGTAMWSQFSPSVVSTLHVGGLEVCAWQYVYGTHPLREAQAGANAVKDGADCLVIDAEGEYEGKYHAAQLYINRLRELIGSSFPVALAGLPYVDYHPSFPYSVFLGPNGAQYNLPQMYWHAIGTTVGTVYAHTYVYNRPYQRPIYPLGQVYQSPPPAQIRRFRQLEQVYQAGGVSWWDWQEARRASWKAISVPVTTLAYAQPVITSPILKKRSAGDLVVWAQEHLLAAGENVTLSGGFGNQTLAAVKNFQSQHGLTVDGIIGPATWAALLTYQPATVNWGKPPSGRLKGTRISGSPTAAAIAAADTGGTPAHGAISAPASALLPDKGYEIPRALGAGRP